MDREDQRVGVALCGAELAGVAHVGVLHSLEQMGVRIHHVAGASSGSLVAVLYAHGYTLRDFEQLVNRFPGIRLTDYGFPLVSSFANVVLQALPRADMRIPNGLIRGKKLYRYIHRLLRNRMARMPYSVVATDMYTARAVVFTNDPQSVEHKVAERSTDLALEVLGSCAMPGVLTPVKLHKWLLVDGGVRDVVPVNALRQAGCDRIIAVDVHQLPADWRPVTTVDVIARSMAALLDEAKVKSDLAGDDVLVIRPDLEWTNWWTARKSMQRNLEIAKIHTQEMKGQVMRFLGQ